MTLIRPLAEQPTEASAKAMARREKRREIFMRVGFLELMLNAFDSHPERGMRLSNRGNSGRGSPPDKSIEAEPFALSVKRRRVDPENPGRLGHVRRSFHHETDVLAFESIE